MLKKVLIIAILSLVIFQGTATAIETEGEVMFRDALYGAAIGVILGGAFALADDGDDVEKLSTGIIFGTFGGLLFGLAETDVLVEIKKEGIKFAFPTPMIEQKGENTQYAATILRAHF